MMKASLLGVGIPATLIGILVGINRVRLYRRDEQAESWLDYEYGRYSKWYALVYFGTAFLFTAMGVLFTVLGVSYPFE